MRIFGIVLIAIGLIMLLTNGIDFTSKKKVLDIGPIKVNKEEKKHINWPIWAGGLAIGAGIVLVVAGKKK